MSFFTDDELAELRVLAVDAMDVFVRLHEPSTRVFNETTGRSTWTLGDTLYTGVADLRPSRPSGAEHAGEMERFLRQATLHLHHEAPLPHENDVIEIVTCTRNTALESETFRVTGVAMDDDHVSWTLTIEHVERARGSA